MQTCIYIREHDCPGLTLLWEGDLPHLPSEGDYVSVWEGWCSERVDSIHFNIEGGPSAEIHLAATVLDGYRTELERRAAEEKP